MKKIFTWLLAVILCLTMAACTDAEGPISSSDPVPPAEAGDNTQADTSADAAGAGAGNEADGQVSPESAAGTTGTSKPATSSTSVCSHVWSQWTQTRPASCTQAGSRTRECIQCAKKETGTIDRLEHQESDWIIDEVATVGKAGSKHTACIHCQKQMQQESIPALTKDHVHKGEEWTVTKRPTCTTKGTKEQVCSCGFVVARETIPATGHTPTTDKAVAATCTTQGLSEGSHCTVCEAIITTQKVLPKTAHDYVNDECRVCHTNKFADTLVFEKTDSGYKLVSIGNCTEPEIVIPATYNGQPVVSIGTLAFSTEYADTYNKTTTHIVVPEGVKTIEPRAFANCKALVSLRLPNSLTTIGDRAFQFCSVLPSIQLPDSITAIPMAAFRGCTALKEVKLGSKTTTIGRFAFDRAGVGTITFPQTLHTIEEGAFLESGLKTCTFKGNLTTLGEQAFAESALETITLPAGLTALPYRAFYECDYLKSVTLSPGIKTIGEQCFSYSTVETVNFPKGLEAIDEAAFSFCKKLAKVDLPEGVKTIGQDAFRYNDSLSSLTLPSTLTTIDGQAFLHCVSLKTLEVPAGLTNAAASFRGCGLESVVFAEGTTVVFANMFYQCDALTSVTLPDSVQEIGYKAFAECAALTFRQLPKNLKSVGVAAFEECHFIDLTLTADLAGVSGLFSGAVIDGLTFDKGVTTIADKLFISTNLTSITVPEGVTAIGNSAFANCTQLTDVSLPASVTSIGSKAFTNCKKLSTLRLPSALRTIGDSAFSGDVYLREIDIPASVTSIGALAFENCGRLQTITVSDLPLGNAFTGCSLLSTVHFRGTVAEAQTNICQAFPYNSKVLIVCTDGEIQR